MISSHSLIYEGEPVASGNTMWAKFFSFITRPIRNQWRFPLHFLEILTTLPMNFSSISLKRIPPPRFLIGLRRWQNGWVYPPMISVDIRLWASIHS